MNNPFQPPRPEGDPRFTLKLTVMAVGQEGEALWDVSSESLEWAADNPAVMFYMQAVARDLLAKIFEIAPVYHANMGISLRFSQEEVEPFEEE